MSGQGASDVFHYYQSPEAYRSDAAGAALAVVPPGITDAKALMTEAGRLLAFPRYYGKNLDAFWDCLTDPDIMPENGTVLAHSDLPALPEAKRAAYLEVLREAVLYWREYDPKRRFDVWFPCSVRSDVETTLPDDV